ncbi:hypothetical protein SALBM311S_02271 [Streptomyces alboniger]
MASLDLRQLQQSGASRLRQALLPMALSDLKHGALFHQKICKGFRRSRRDQRAELWRCFSGHLRGTNSSLVTASLTACLDLGQPQESENSRKRSTFLLSMPSSGLKHGVVLSNSMSQLDLGP